jgi:hypothetical protein
MGRAVSQGWPTYTETPPPRFDVRLFGDCRFVLLPISGEYDRVDAVETRPRAAATLRPFSPFSSFTNGSSPKRILPSKREPHGSRERQCYASVKRIHIAYVMEELRRFVTVRSGAKLSEKSVRFVPMVEASRRFQHVPRCNKRRNSSGVYTDDTGLFTSRCLPPFTGVHRMTTQPKAKTLGVTLAFSASWRFNSRTVKHRIPSV